MGFDFGWEGSRSWIATVSRVDVVTHPRLGCATTPPQSARYDPAAPGATPFASSRLERAIRAPDPPYAVVVADSDAGALLQDSARRGTPMIVAIPAFERLLAQVPSVMVGLCWRRGDPRGGRGFGPAEHEALLAAHLLLLMLALAPPEEIAWLGGLASPAR